MAVKIAKKPTPKLPGQVAPGVSTKNKTAKRRPAYSGKVAMPKDPETPTLTGQKPGQVKSRIKVGDEMGNAWMMAAGAKPYDAKMQRTKPPKEQPKKIRLPK